MTTWYEIEAKRPMYGWMKTMVLPDPDVRKEGGFKTLEDAQAYIDMMRASNDLYYREADYRLVECTRKVLD